MKETALKAVAKDVVETYRALSRKMWAMYRTSSATSVMVKEAKPGSMSE